MRQIANHEFRLLAEFIQKHSGIHLKKEKKALLASRLDTLLQQLGFDSFSEYYRYVQADASGEAVSALMDRITTNHTFFMRESAHFDFLRDSVLPELYDRVRERDLRIWSAGCSSGEEPYTLAMILDRFFLPLRDQALWDRKVLATDLSAEVLAKAQRGVYPSSSIETLPASWRSSYFRSLADGQLQVVDALKRQILFRKFNLMEEVYPFRNKFHLIFCRNVMIYFDQETKLRLLRRLYDMTEPGGYLFISHTESLDPRVTGYRQVRPSVYRKQ